MKGTFFSADFVTDKNDDLRLIEINTDTGIVKSQAFILDWTDFISLLSDSGITQIEVIYKYDIQHPIVKSLSDALSANAPFITGFTETIVPAESIFPPSSTDAENKFILRMAYDETAILDSEYAKGTLNLLTLFLNAGDSGSITNFYHSSSYYGYYNTLDTEQFNGSNLPDMVSKTVIELHTPHKFWKIGHSVSGSLERYNDFLSTTANGDNIFQQYHISPSQISNGVVSSIRSFCIVYGSNLDVCYVAEYEIDSVFDLPTGSISFDDSIVSNLLDSKHYYEYATNTIKNTSHGILENEFILDSNNQEVQVKDMIIGNSYSSYYIEGAPNTDDYDILREWSYSGHTLPSGSYATSSILVGLYEDTTYANDATEIKFENGESVVVGGEARMLVHNKNTDISSYQRVVDLSTDFSIFGQNETTSSISEINLVIYDEQQPLYTMNMENVDNFILSSGNFVSFFVVHNLIGGSCFVAGTKVLMADGTEKNIEEVVEGDEVLSFNEETLQNESKKVIGLKMPIHDDLVKYYFDNETTITSTFDHPYYINGSDLASFTPFLTNKRYEIGREVKQIKIGDIVSLSTSNSNASIINIEELPKVDTQTYIITVEDNHNFYANNILVHNK